MRAIRWMASLLLLAALCLSCSPNAAAQDASAAGGAKQPPYTMAEYNSFQAANAEKNPVAQIKLLDDFVAKYPNSALLNYIYPLYYKNYYAQKNYPKAIEYADKMLAMGDKLSPAERYDAHYVRAYAFNAIQNPDPETAKAARTAALAGLKVLDQLPKPEGEDDAKFAAEKKQSLIVFNGTAATAAMAAKDYAGAIESYKAVLALAPDDLVSNYKLGQAYMAIAPPQQLDAIWYFARAATSKSANEQQSKSVKAYIRKVIAVYQGGTVCDTLTDAARKDMTIATVVTDLKAGGDKAKITWTAACGLEFPDVPGKLLEITTATDTIELKTAFVTSDAEFEAATTPNMDVIIKKTDQPEAAKLEKGNPVRFTGTLETYDPDPAFMLHWDKAKVNAEDLPKAGPAKKPAARKPAPKKPGN